MFGKAFNCATLVGCITPLEQNNDFLPSRLDPILNLQQLDLQLDFVLFVVASTDLSFVGIFPGLKKMTDRIQIVT